MTVDFAMIAAPLILLIVGTMEVGRLLWYQNALNYSVEEAARCATVDVNNCNTTDQVKSYAAGRSAAGFASSVFSLSSPACGNQVAASYPMSLSIPLVPVSLTLTAQSCYPK
ncbi:MAG: TadE/TadG family type IV pilus assembly protein [Stellaceae bacterium]